MSRFEGSFGSTRVRLTVPLMMMESDVGPLLADVLIVFHVIFLDLGAVQQLDEFIVQP